MSDSFERKTITPAEREARKLFRQAEAAKAMTEHERAQQAFNETGTVEGFEAGPRGQGNNCEVRWWFCEAA